MKLTPRQKEVLRKVRDGWELWGEGVLVKSPKLDISETVRPNTLCSLRNKGLIELTAFYCYELTEKGEKVNVE